MTNPELMKIAERYFPPKINNAADYDEHADLNASAREKAVEMAKEWHAQQMRLLASALRKVLPLKQFQELIDSCDPLSAFLRDGFGVAEIFREAETSSEPNNEYLNGLLRLQKEQK